MRPSASPPDPVATLEKLLAIPVGEPQQALVAAADLVAASFGADKVDVFLYEARRDTLVALGSSVQPLSSLQHKHGLDVLALGNGGRAVEVFTTGRIFVSGALESDPAELRGVKETLHVRSMIGVPLDVAGERRGVLALAALAPDRWTEADGQFAAVVARWVGIVLRQSELARELTESSVAAGRRMAAEELVTVFAHDARNVVYPVDLTVHAIGRRAERDGRGLYLARRIALGHHGNLTFEPQRGGGARFVLSLPCVGA